MCRLVSFPDFLFRIEYLILGRAKDSASAPGTGTVGDEETEEGSYPKAFKNLYPRNALHKSSFSKIEKCKACHGTHQDGDEGLSGMCWTKRTFQPASLRFKVQFFELHLCKYIDV